MKKGEFRSFLFRTEQASADCLPTVSKTSDRGERSEGEERRPPKGEEGDRTPPTLGKLSGKFARDRQVSRQYLRKFEKKFATLALIVSFELKNLVKEIMGNLKIILHQLSARYESRE